MTKVAQMSEYYWRMRRDGDGSSSISVYVHDNIRVSMEFSSHNPYSAGSTHFTIDEARQFHAMLGEALATVPEFAEVDEVPQPELELNTVVVRGDSRPPYADTAF
jgi:hypothetical protein